MLRLYSRRGLVHREQRFICSTTIASFFSISHHGMDTLWKNVKAASPSGQAPAGTKGHADPSLHVTLDFKDLARQVAQAAKLRDAALSSLRKAQPSSPQQSAAADAKTAGDPASKEDEAFNKMLEFWQQQLEAMSALGSAPSKFTFYKTLLQECKSPPQGTLANFLKRLISKSQVQALQEQAEKLEAREKAMQAQADQLKAMTADRDKWMMQSEDLLASARKHGWMKEAQLRAAASIAGKRADDEAEHARQRTAAVQGQPPTHKGMLGAKFEAAHDSETELGDASNAQGGVSEGRSFGDKAVMWQCCDQGPSSEACTQGEQFNEALSSQMSTVMKKLNRLKTDSQQLVNHMSHHTLRLANQHSQVGHLIGRELQIAEILGVSIKTLSNEICAQLEPHLHKVLANPKGTGSVSPWDSLNSPDCPTDFLPNAKLAGTNDYPTDVSEGTKPSASACAAKGQAVQWYLRQAGEKTAQPISEEQLSGSQPSKTVLRWGKGLGFTESDIAHVWAGKLALNANLRTDSEHDHDGNLTQPLNFASFQSANWSLHQAAKGKVETELERWKQRCQDAESEMAEVSQACQHQLKQIEELKRAAASNQEQPVADLKSPEDSQRVHALRAELGAVHSLAKEAAVLSEKWQQEDMDMSKSQTGTTKIAAEADASSPGQVAAPEVGVKSTSAVKHEHSLDANGNLAFAPEQDVNALVGALSMGCRDWAAKTQQLQTVHNRRNALISLQAAISKCLDTAKHVQTGDTVRAQVLADHTARAYQLLQNSITAGIDVSVKQAELMRDETKLAAFHKSAELTSYLHSKSAKARE